VVFLLYPELYDYEMLRRVYINSKNWCATGSRARTETIGYFGELAVCLAFTHFTRFTILEQAVR